VPRSSFRRAPSPSGGAPPHRGSERPFRRVLLPTTRRTCGALVHAMLETLGYEVIEARDGSRAVEIFRAAQRRSSLVILDLVMPA